jgi:uncharacterized protein (TIGR03067 family)
MKHALIALFLVGSVAAADDKESGKWLEKIAGSYSVVSLEKGGEPASADFIKKFNSVTIKGNKLTISFKESTDAGAKTEDKAATITVDPSKTPVTIDLKADDGPKKNETVLGIVEVGDGTVKLCWGDGLNAKRPVDATSTKENKNFLITLKQIKE